MAPSGPPEQIRSWNLSSLWRLPTTGGDAWLKVVPPFFAHEGAILEALAGAPVPALLGHDGPRVILAGIPGEDQYDAPLPQLHAMVDILVGIQVAWLGRAEELRAIGLPDWRASALTAAIADLVERAGHRVAAADRVTLADFVEGLPARFEAIAACGLGDGLVHGDCHPGNVRGEGSNLVLLDWGDCGVGHPLLDMPGFLDRIDPAQVAPVRDRWLARWRDLVPGSDPERAAALIAPVAAARMALVYQRFLDGIESSEHPYHQADVPDWLGRTAVIARAERPATDPLARGAPREPSRPTWQTVRRTATTVGRSMEVLVRERGVQSRRARASEPGANPPGSSGGPGFWPALAIIAVIIATAGWTTVGVLVVNDKPAAVASGPIESDEAIDEESTPPDEEIPPSHLFADLEASLPTVLECTTLDVQSFTGTEFIFDDSWGTSMSAFLTSVGKTPADLQIAQAQDPDGVLDLEVVLAFRLPGVEPEKLRDAVINGWRVDFPELTTGTATIGDKDITTGVFAEDTPASMWYIKDGVVYDIESGDEALGKAILAGLPPASAAPAPSATCAPPSAEPAESAAP